MRVLLSKALFSAVLTLAFAAISCTGETGSSEGATDSCAQTQTNHDLVMKARNAMNYLANDPEAKSNQDLQDQTCTQLFADLHGYPARCVGYYDAEICSYDSTDDIATAAASINALAGRFHSSSLRAQR